MHSSGQHLGPPHQHGPAGDARPRGRGDGGGRRHPATMSAGSAVTMLPGARSASSSYQKAVMAVSTRPLSGIGSAKTTSKALIRSEATISSRPSPRRRGRGPCPSATRGRSTLTASGPSVDARPAPPGTGRGAAGTARGRRPRPARPASSVTSGSSARTWRRWRPLVPGRGGRRAGRSGRPRRGRAPTPTSASSTDWLKTRPRDPSVRLAQRPLGVDHQPGDQPGGLAQQVAGEQRGVGQDHPLDRAVRDVPLVPERHVLQPGADVAAQHPGQPA